ncbi:unnamed protein product, partial [marine sediment metagenome]
TILPEINGIEPLERAQSYLRDGSTPASYMGAYTVPASGSYNIKMKWQEQLRNPGWVSSTYESYFKILGNKRTLIVQHMRG